MSRKEQVDRVMAAVVHHEYIGTEAREDAWWDAEHPDEQRWATKTYPLVDPLQEYYLTDSQWRFLVRRILAAADGVAEFTDTTDVSDAAQKAQRAERKRQSKRKRNLAAFEEYKNRRKS